MMEYWYAKTKYRKIMLVTAVLQLLGFFVLPYAKAYKLTSAANALSELTGFKFPKNLTGFSLYRLSDAIGGDFGPYLLVLLAMMVVVLAVHIPGKGKGSYIASLVAEVIVFILQSALMSSAGSFSGYEKSRWILVILLICLVLMVVSVLGILFEQREQEKLSYTGGGAQRHFDTDKFAGNVGVAGNVAARLAKQAAAQLARIPGAVQGTVDSARQSAGSSASHAPRGAAGPASVSHGAIPAVGLLTGVKGAFAGAKIPLNSGEELILGRSAEICSVILEGDLVSRKHCSILYDGKSGRYLVTDFSENGTYIAGGKRIPARQRTVLMPGTVLWIGSKEISFQLG